MSGNAFVITGGASLGAVHVGMLEALYEKGITPDLIVGTSVGAVNGAFIATRPQSPATAHELGEVWRSLTRSDVFPLHFAEGLFGFIGWHSHFVPNRALRRLLTRHLGPMDLEDSPIPLHVIATNAVTGDEVRLSTGPMVDSVLASSAIAGIFPPIILDGEILIDGGASNFAPISHAVELGAETVYVLTSGSACALSRVPRGAIPMFLHSTSMLVTRRLRVEIELLADRTRLVVLPPPCPVRVPPHDFSRADELIRTSLQTTRAFLGFLDGTDAWVPSPAHLSGHGQVGVPPHLWWPKHREQMSGGPHTPADGEDA